MNGPYDRTPARRAAQRVHVQAGVGPPVCWATRADAERYAAGVDEHHGAHRTWTYRPCDCPGEGR